MQHANGHVFHAALLLLASSASLACGGTPSDFPVKYRIMAEEPTGANALTRGALLVADNQQQYLYGKPVWIRTPLADRFVGTAIRAPELDLFGPSALEWILDNYSEQKPTIHLGDGLNLSCLAEYDGFLATMRRAKGPWFMAPGNHDGIYFGSASSESEWKDVCDHGGGPITQATFVERYVSEVLAGQPSPGQPPPVPSPDIGTQRFARDFAGRRKGGSFEYPNADAECKRVVPGQIVCPLLTRVAWHVDDREPWRSFVVQEITMTRPGPKSPAPVKYVLFDTSNYESKPALIPSNWQVNPGTNGDLTDTQLAVVEGWYAKGPAPNEPGAPLIVFMGHHPFGTLTARAQAAVEKLRRRFGVLLYVSAHTHHGNYFVNGPEDSSWVELNVGSTVDWPLEFRSFRLAETAEHVPYSLSELFELGVGTTVQDAPECKDEWLPQRKDPDYYINYTKDVNLTPDQTEALIFNSLLGAYRRLLQNVPSSPDNAVWPVGTNATSDATLLELIDKAAKQSGDSAGRAAKRDLLLALEPFDRTRSLQAPPGGTAEQAQTLHRDYRLCQAIWSSQDDQNGVRKARREDWFVSYPKR